VLLAAPVVEALYSVSYALKFALKRGPRQLDYRVMPLEGLWWVEDMTQFSIERKSDWEWTMMIRQPDEVDEDLLEQAVHKASAKKDLPALPLLRLERFTEGLAAQIMHIGPYAAEGPTIQRLHAFIAEQGYERAGKHHEIYLGDPRRSAPEKLKTISASPSRSPDGRLRRVVAELRKQLDAAIAHRGAARLGDEARDGQGRDHRTLAAHRVLGFTHDAFSRASALPALDHVCAGLDRACPEERLLMRHPELSGRRPCHRTYVRPAISPAPDRRRRAPRRSCTSRR
jgi:hypothetical protein